MSRGVFTETKPVAREVLEVFEFLAMIWHTSSVELSSRSLGTVSLTGLR